MDHENPQTKNSHELAIALIQKDMEYIKKGMDSLTLTLTAMDRDFARRSEITALSEVLKKINESLDKKATHEDFTKLSLVVDSKVNKSEFDPIQKTLSRINWILISAVVTGLIALLYNAGNK